MQTPLHLPYPLSSFNLASVLDHSGLLNPKENQNSSALSPGAMADSKWLDVQPNLSNCDEAMSQLLFQPSFFGTGMHPSIYAKSARNNEGLGGPWSGRGENIFLKRASGTSFSIDSLLGINDVIHHSHSGPTPTIREHHHHVHYSCVYGPAPLNGKNSFNGLNVPHGVPRPREPEQGQFFSSLKKRKAGINGRSTCNNSVARGMDSAPKLKQQAHGKAPAMPGSKTSFTTNKMACLSTKTSAGLAEKVQDSGQNSVRRATKTKRVRTIFTPEQLERLEAEFERQQYMVGPERLFLASSLHLTEAQVKVWFQNRRIKWRKQHLELQQQRLAVIRSQRIGIGDSDESSGSEFGSSAAASSTSTVLSLCNNENNNIMMEAGMNNNYAQHHHLAPQDSRHLVIKGNPI